MELVLYRAAILHAYSPQQVEFFSDGGLLVEKGTIRACGNFSTVHSHVPTATVVDWRGSIIIPGLVDLHAHLPQLSAIGCERSSLLQWLDEVIFPLEQQFRDPNHVEEHAEAFFRRALSGGTTAMAVFAPPYEEATNICFEAAAAVGIRATMGMTLMDINAPAALLGSPDALIAATERLLHRWHGVGRLRYCVTPRFAGSCSEELLRRCSEVAKHHDLLIQTHLAESPGELSLIRELFPHCPDYTSLYRACGILSERTVLAHCIYLSEDELHQIEHTGAAIAHCPASNAYLQSGIMPLVEYLERGMHRIGLGTDIGAGYHGSILNEARTAREQAKLRRIFTGSLRIPTLEEAFYLATLGGAEALGLAQQIGNFAVGKAADFVRIMIPPYRTISSARAALETVLYIGQENIAATIIEGELCWQRP